MRLNKQRVIGAGFAAFRATGLHKMLAPLTRGRGAILMLHHVRPARASPFAPNALLEITPDFLDGVLGHLRALGYDLVTMDALPERLGRQADDRPFAALTFDDGYQDLVQHALPVLEKHQAPFTAYITSGFADRAASLWWLELEEAIRASTSVRNGTETLRTETAAEKLLAYQSLYWRLRAGPEPLLLATIGELASRAGVDRSDLVARLCLDWDGVRRLAQHPLCTIGAHTVSHPMLAKHAEPDVRRELGEGRRRIEEEIGLPVRHLAYPVGDPTSAGAREFAIAAELGFSSAVTTRPGMIFADHLAHPTALPRLSLNGHWQSLAALDVLLTGVPFALWNRGRRVA